MHCPMHSGTGMVQWRVWVQCCFLGNCGGGGGRVHSKGSVVLYPLSAKTGYNHRISKFPGLVFGHRFLFLSSRVPAQLAPANLRPSLLSLLPGNRTSAPLVPHPLDSLPFRHAHMGSSGLKAAALHSHRTTPCRCYVDHS